MTQAFIILSGFCSRFDSSNKFDAIPFFSLKNQNLASLFITLTQPHFLVSKIKTQNLASFVITLIRPRFLASKI